MTYYDMIVAKFWHRPKEILVRNRCLISPSAPHSAKNVKNAQLPVPIDVATRWTVWLAQITMNKRRFMTKVIARDRLSSCLYQDSHGLVAMIFLPRLIANAILFHQAKSMGRMWQHLAFWPMLDYELCIWHILKTSLIISPFFPCGWPQRIFCRKSGCFTMLYQLYISKYHQI